MYRRRPYSPGQESLLNELLQGGQAEQPSGPINRPNASVTAPIMEEQRPEKKASGGGMGGMGGMPSPAMFSGMMGGEGIGGMFGGGASAAGGGAGAGGSATGGMMSGLGAAGPYAIPIAAVIGATTLSANADQRKGGSENWLDWLGPVKNIPENAIKGDWDAVMSDGAMGPVGGIYNMARGKDIGKSFLNSLGPLGQVPLAFGKGEVPYKGEKGSRTFIDAFTGKGIW